MTITRDDLADAIPERVLIQLTQDQHHATEADGERLDRAIRYATSTANGYLGNRYDLPITQPSAQLQELCVDIARHWLYLRRPEGSKDLPPAVVRMYENAIAQLKAIQAGKAKLIFDDVSENGDTTDGAVTDEPNQSSKIAVRASDRTFGDAHLGSY